MGTLQVGWLPAALRLAPSHFILLLSPRKDLRGLQEKKKPSETYCAELERAALSEVEIKKRWTGPRRLLEVRRFLCVSSVVHMGANMKRKLINYVSDGILFNPG